MRIYGLEKLQEHIRTQVQLARDFVGMLQKDERFEIVSNVNMGLACFRLKVMIMGIQRTFNRSYKFLTIRPSNV